ncbi:MAG: ATP-dependent Clp protease proteolytic subunit [Persephonella sp.]|nr:ATP-dependent Clp protease proteolytic subunit [Persephonella sp.]
MKALAVMLFLIFSIFSYAQVIVGQWSDAVTPVMADYVERLIKEGEKKSAKLIILELDTPGGLESAMRDVVKSMMNTYIPFVVYIYPSGGRAASAGAIITIASDVAVMAPSTNIGSASPVQMTGRDIDETMKKKIINDMVAFVKGIAKEKGRDVKIVEKMITESVNLSAEEALKKG